MSDPSSSYYGQPVVKQPTWTPEIPSYFFLGGLSGASAALAFAAGDTPLGRRAWLASLAAIGVSPVLLISDLGVPSRFLNMLRVFKVTSPMSVGTWIVSASGATTAVAALHAWTGRLPGPARVARPAAALLGLPLSTYTAALVAQTAIPVWHDARTELPFVFAAGAAVSAGAAAVALTAPEHAAPARRLTALGAVAEIGTMTLMERRLGDLVGEPYSTGKAGRYKRLAHGLVGAGAATAATAGRTSRPAAIAGGVAVLAGALAERWSVYRAGFQSAADPKYTVAPQRARIASGQSRGASRRGRVTAPQ